MTTTLTPHARTILLNRVPEVTVAFWLIKILATTSGETAADLLNDNLGLGLSRTSLIMTGLLAVALVAQFLTKRYTPVLYWLCIVLISVVGTLITDNLSEKFGVPLWVSTIIFAVLLAVTFGIWFARERSLSIHSIFTRRREAFYWVAILFTFALGTATGDYLSEALSLGYPLAVVIFAAAIGIVVIARFVLHANAVFCFWAAYVLTRPLGASVGDLLSQKRVDGGLQLGTIRISLLFLAVITIVVVYLSVKIHRQRREAEVSGLDLTSQIELVTP